MWPFSSTEPSGFSWYSTAEEVTQGIDGSGLTAIVTGASSGIGAETTRVLAMRGVHVVMAVRNVSAGNKVKQEILKEILSARIDVLELDLSSFASIRKFVSEFEAMNLALNILINNAGVMGIPFTLSKDGIEMHFATNYLGHFLLTNLLLENMKTTSSKSNIEGRIVNVSSWGHKVVYREGICFDKINDESMYRSYLAYGQSKLSNILHAKELFRRLKEEGINVTANSVHPGAIMTNLFRNSSYLDAVIRCIGNLVMKTVQQGAATTCYVALNHQVCGIGGEYFSNSNTTKPSEKALDKELARKLWDFSLGLVA